MEITYKESESKADLVEVYNNFQEYQSENHRLFNYRVVHVFIVDFQDENVKKLKEELDLSNVNRKLNFGN